MVYDCLPCTHEKQKCRQKDYEFHVVQFNIIALAQRLILQD